MTTIYAKTLSSYKRVLKMETRVAKESHGSRRTYKSSKLLLSGESNITNSLLKKMLNK